MTKIDLHVGFNAHFLSRLKSLQMRARLHSLRRVEWALHRIGVRIPVAPLFYALSRGRSIRDWTTLIDGLCALSRRYGAADDTAVAWLQHPLHEEIFSTNVLTYPERFLNIPSYYLCEAMWRNDLNSDELSARINRSQYGPISAKTIQRWMDGFPMARGLTVLPILSQVLRVPCEPLIPRGSLRLSPILDFQFQKVGQKEGRQ